jgi:hypothetical protein
VTETRFLLSERTNPHSSVRADGNRWWGYPTRRAQITAIVVHTAESLPSPASALNVARWQAFTADVPSSYHVLTDSGNTVRTGLDSQTMFHAARFNSPSLGLSFATKAMLWGRYPVWDELALARGAAVCRVWQAEHGIPARWLSRAEAFRGVKGFVRHSVIDPDRRGDPGVNFPAARFFRLLEQGDVMTPAQEAKLDEVLRHLSDRRTRGYLARELEVVKLAQARVDAAVPKLAAEVSARVIADLPAGTISAKAVADTVADVLSARLKA